MTPEDTGDGHNPPAAPAALIGLGAAGGRLVSRVRERWAHSAPPNADGLLLLTPDASEDAPAEAVREAAHRLMRQRTVSVLEKRFSVRRPSRRYLALHLIFTAALADTPADVLLRCLDAALGLQHPAAGLEVLFLLDVTGPGADDRAATGLAEALCRLEEAIGVARNQQARRWSAAARVRVLLAHPHRADGSRLDHPCFTTSQAAAASSAVPTRVITTESALAEDEFEEALASVLVGHVAAGAFFDRLAAGEDTEPFALFGWSRDVLPREHILEAAARCLAADAIARTADAEPGDAERSLDPGGLVGRDDPDAWRAWVGTRDAVLLDRRALLRRLLLSARPGTVAVEDAAPAVPQRTWYMRLLHWFWGEARVPQAAGERPLRVRLAMPSPERQFGGPQGWPDALRRLDKEAAAKFEAVLAELRSQDLPQTEAAGLCAALSRCVDVSIRGHLGGTLTGHKIIAEALASARERITASGAIPFATPPAPEGAGLRPDAGLSGAWAAYCAGCDRLPGWPAALSAGLSYGAFIMTALATFGLPTLLIGCPLAAACVVAAAARQAVAIARLRRLGDYLHAGVEAKYGRRLLEWAEQTAGSPDHDGIYQAVIHYLHDWEKPALVQFEAEREAAVTGLRRVHPFPFPPGTDELLADAEAVPDLYAVVREAGGDAATADDARSLLQQYDVFADWRTPLLKKGVADACQFVRRSRLYGWERSERSLGEFLRGLLAVRVIDAHREAAFAAWLRQRLDRLALRAAPLALMPPSHPERDDGLASRDRDVSVVVAVAAPGSLEWRTADGASAADSSRPPVDSGVQDLAAWFGAPALAGTVISDEAEETACLVLMGGLSAAEALSAFPVAEEPAPVPAQSDAAPVNGTNGNGTNGHARRPVANVAREAAEEEEAA